MRETWKISPIWRMIKCAWCVRERVIYINWEEDGGVGYTITGAARTECLHSGFALYLIQCCGAVAVSLPKWLQIVVLRMSVDLCGRRTEKL